VSDVQNCRQEDVFASRITLTPCPSFAPLENIITQLQGCQMAGISLAWLFLLLI